LKKVLWEKKCIFRPFFKDFWGHFKLGEREKEREKTLSLSGKAEMERPPHALRVQFGGHGSFGLLLRERERGREKET